MKNQKIRSMKVHEQSGYNYKATPTIILKGQWLKEMGRLLKLNDLIKPFKDIHASALNNFVVPE